MRWVGRVAFLTAIWVLLWGEVSIANVASGALLATGLLVLYPPGSRAEPRRSVTVRPVALVRLLAHILVQVVVANVLVARQILSRRPASTAGVVRYEFVTDSRLLMTFVATILAMSPGTMPVHVDTDRRLIAVHVLRLHSPDDVRRSIRRLEELSRRALSPRDLAAAVT